MKLQSLKIARWIELPTGMNKKKIYRMRRKWWCGSGSAVDHSITPLLTDKKHLGMLLHFYTLHNSYSGQKTLITMTRQFGVEYTEMNISGKLGTPIYETLRQLPKMLTFAQLNLCIYLHGMGTNMKSNCGWIEVHKLQYPRVS